MTTQSTTLGPTTVTFDEASQRKTSVFSNSSEEEDPDHPTHKQDWSKTTAEKDTWAARERRRSSMFAKIDSNAPSTSPSKIGSGSILSIWQKGKDKNGNDILIHDGHDHDAAHAERVLVVEPPVEVDTFGIPKKGRRSLSGGKEDRRGSVLSMWTQGKDKKGNSVMLHNDDAWSEEEEEEVVEPPKPAPIDLNSLNESERLRVEELVRSMRDGAVV